MRTGATPGLAVSTRRTALLASPTHKVVPSTATEVGDPPTLTTPRTLPDAVSMRETDPEPVFATHRAPAPMAMALGRQPTGMGADRAAPLDGSR